MDKSYITEESFGKIFSYLKSRKDIHCKNPQKTRTFLEGVYFMMRTGAQWMELPACYGKYKTVHKRFLSWAKKDIGSDILSFFAQESDVESFLIDGPLLELMPVPVSIKRILRKNKL